MPAAAASYVTLLGSVPSRGEVTKQPRPLCPPPHMTRPHVSETFHWPLGQVPLGVTCVWVCVCVRACGCAGMYFHVYTCLCLYRVSHLWYIYTATWRDTKANIHLCSTHFYHSEQGRICLCAHICVFIGVNVRILCQHVSPCSPRRHARRSGSLMPCQSTRGTPGWGGWRSLLGPVWLHTPLKTDWRLGSTCLHTTEQGGGKRKWCHWTIIWMNSMQTVTSTLWIITYI